MIVANSQNKLQISLVIHSIALQKSSVKKTLDELCVKIKLHCKFFEHIWQDMPFVNCAHKWHAGCIYRTGLWIWKSIWRVSQPLLEMSARSIANKGWSMISRLFSFIKQTNMKFIYCSVTCYSCHILAYS